MLVSALMWILWSFRISGNANFFWFQTFAYNAAIVIFYINLFIAVDEKRKRYSRKVSG